MLTEKNRAVIFDLDGTLYNRDAAQIHVVKFIAERFPQIFGGLSTETIVEAFLESDRLSVIDFEAGKPPDRLQRSRSFLRLLSVCEDHADAITEMYLRHYPRTNIPVREAVPVVKELSKRFPLAVISNGLPDVQYKKIEAIGLGGVFSCIVLSEEVGIRKPDPRIFQWAAHMIKIPCEECLYVGDSYRNDVIGARSAGLRTCWYNPASSPGEEAQSGADIVIASLGQLLTILEDQTKSRHD